MRLHASILIAVLIAIATTEAAVADGGSRERASSAGVVYTAVWKVGVPGRFTRTEWYEPATGNTRQLDTGGPSCTRNIVFARTRRKIVIWGCGPRTVVRVRGSRDRTLVWATSDLLRPKRLLRLGEAREIGPVTVRDRPAVRIELPLPPNSPASGRDFADVDPATQLPLQFVYERDGFTYMTEIDVRRVARSSLPRKFFLPRPLG